MIKRDQLVLNKDKELLEKVPLIPLLVKWAVEQARQTFVATIYQVTKDINFEQNF